MASGPKSDKLWADAVRRAVMREAVLTDEDGTKRKVQYIHIIAGKLAALAAEGDTAAIREIGDRLDGKPMQAVEATGNITITISSDDASVA